MTFGRPWRFFQRLYDRRLCSSTHLATAAIFIFDFPKKTSIYLRARARRQQRRAQKRSAYSCARMIARSGVANALALIDYVHAKNGQKRVYAHERVLALHVR